MFDIGFQELVIIFVVALLVFGPKRLPEVGRTLGKWIGEIRSSIQTAKAQMESEFELAERKKPDDYSLPPEKGPSEEKGSGTSEGAQADADKKGEE
jgi:Tat protein translocase TatB subunit